MPQNNSGSGKHDSDQIKADAANAAKGICPETGLDLSGINVDAHLAHYFPNWEKADPKSDHARRARLIADYGAKRDAKKQAPRTEAQS